MSRPAARRVLVLRLAALRLGGLAAGATLPGCVLPYPVVVPVPVPLPIPEPYRGKARSGLTDADPADPAGAGRGSPPREAATPPPP